MTSVKGDILSAFHSTTRRVLGGAAISAVLLGAGSGMAFAADIDNSGSQNPTFADQSNNAVAGDGAVGGTGGAGGTGTGTGGAGAGTNAAGGNGGTGGSGGSVGDHAPTQNYSNQQQQCATDQTANVTGDNNVVNQSVTCNYKAYTIQQGAGSTYGVMNAAHATGAKSAGSAKSHAAKSSSSGSASSSQSGSSAVDNTPVGAASTGDGSFVLASSSSDLGDQVALGGAISAAALLGAYGVSIARRRVAAHQA